MHLLSSSAAGVRSHVGENKRGLKRSAREADSGNHGPGYPTSRILRGGKSIAETEAVMASAKSWRRWGRVGISPWRNVGHGVLIDGVWVNSWARWVLTGHGGVDSQVAPLLGSRS